MKRFSHSVHARALGAATAFALIATAARAAAVAPEMHGVDMLPILEGLVLIIIGAKLGGVLLARIGQSPVLGELLVGVLLGNVGLIGFREFDMLRELQGLDILAQIGVLFLLFEVGLHSNVKQMLAVGASSMIVAVLGVVAPMVLGYFCSAYFFPHHHPLSHWFVGATLCATSVGITARVLKDLKRETSTEGRIILGAAVIDDVLGLIVLAVVSGIIAATNQGRPFELMTGVWILLKAIGFLVGAIVLGRLFSKHLFLLAGRLATDHMLLAVALGICFTLAFLAGRFGLAPIVGAFAAGLILDEVEYHDLREADRKKRDIPELLEPLATFLVPVFFVLMGMRVDLSSFANPGVLGFAGALTVAAVIGKQVCSFGVLEKKTDRFAVGLGMIPRGEVGLIFAGIGATLQIAGERVVNDGVFSAVVMMVALTTFMTPPLVVWRLGPSKG